VAEWLWEDFGRRVKPEWGRLRRAILGDASITVQDMISLFHELGLELSDEAWYDEDEE
jgi:hypothetical protein